MKYCINTHVGSIDWKTLARERDGSRNPEARCDEVMLLRAGPEANDREGCEGSGQYRYKVIASECKNYPLDDIS